MPAKKSAITRKTTRVKKGITVSQKKRIMNKAKATLALIKQNRNKIQKYTGYVAVGAVLSKPILKIVRNALDSYYMAYQKADILPYPQETAGTATIGHELQRMDQWLQQVPFSKHCYGPQRNSPIWLEAIAKTRPNTNVCIQPVLMIKVPGVDFLTTPLSMYILENKAVQLLTFNMLGGRVGKIGWDLSKCNENADIGVIPLIVMLSPAMAHANIFIINYRRKTIERFDPNGGDVYNTKEVRDMYEKAIFDKEIRDQALSQAQNAAVHLDKYILGVWKGLLPDFKYFGPMESCPALGPQYYQQLGALACDAKLGTGFCVTWTLIYGHLRILRPEVSTKAIAEAMISHYSKDALAEFVLKYNYMIERSFPYLFMRHAVKNDKIKSPI
jgi:hypothetical protein